MKVSEILDIKFKEMVRVEPSLHNLILIKTQWNLKMGENKIKNKLRKKDANFIHLKPI